MKTPTDEANEISRKLHGLLTDVVTGQFKLDTIEAHRQVYDVLVEAMADIHRLLQTQSVSEAVQAEIVALQAITLANLRAIRAYLGIPEH